MESASGNCVSGCWVWWGKRCGRPCCAWGQKCTKRFGQETLERQQMATSLWSQNPSVAPENTSSVGRIYQHVAATWNPGKYHVLEHTVQTQGLWQGRAFSFSQKAFWENSAFVGYGSQHLHPSWVVDRWLPCQMGQKPICHCYYNELLWPKRWHFLQAQNSLVRLLAANIWLHVFLPKAVQRGSFEESLFPTSKWVCWGDQQEVCGQGENNASNFCNFGLVLPSFDIWVLSMQGPCW